MKKVLSIILSLAMLLSIAAGLDFSALADDKTLTSGDYEYSVLDDGTAEITKYNGSESVVTIPSTLDDKSVTSIGYEAFSGCTGLTSIIIPDGATSIGDEAFRNCTGLTSVTIPQSVTYIGEVIFCECKSENINIYYGGSKKQWNEIAPDDGWIKRTTIHCAIETQFPESGSCGDTASYTFNASTGELYITGTGVINDEAFDSVDKIRSLIIDDGITSIGSYAFYKCDNLKSAVIPNSVTSICEGAFQDCYRLENVSLPLNNANIDWYSFDGTKCAELGKDNGAIYIDNILFYLHEKNEHLSSLSVKDGTKGILSGAFAPWADKLKTISIPSSVKIVGENIFASYGGVNVLKDVYLYSTSLSGSNIENMIKSMPKGSTLHAYSSTGAMAYCSKYGIRFAAFDPQNLANKAPAKKNSKSVNNINLSAQIKTFKNKTVKFKKVKKGKKSFTATWKKVAGVDGYQIQYSLKKNMKKSKTKTVKASKSKLTVKKLKKGKKYYVRIRSYKTINGKKVYGKWSAKKTVKVK